MEHESFKEAFNIPLVIKHAFSASYILASLISFLIFFITSIVLGLFILLLIISVIGIVIIPFILLVYYFWMAVTAYTIMGQAYGEL